MNSISDWSSKTGTPKKTIWSRLNAGKTPDEAVGIISHTGKWSRKAKINVDGVERTVAEWSEKTGVSEKTICLRNASGWSPAQCVGLEAPPGSIEWEGKYYTQTELAKIHGLKRQTFSMRRKSGFSLKEALTEPLNKRKGRVSKLSHEDRNEARQDWLNNQEMSATDVAAKYGLRIKTLLKYFGRRKVAPQSQWNPDVDTRAKAQSDWLNNSEMSSNEVAEKYGVCKTTLFKYFGAREIRRGRPRKIGTQDSGYKP